MTHCCEQQLAPMLQPLPAGRQLPPWPHTPFGVQSWLQHCAPSWQAPPFGTHWMFPAQAPFTQARFWQQSAFAAHAAP